VKDTLQKTNSFAKTNDKQTNVHGLSSAFHYPLLTVEDNFAPRHVSLARPVDVDRQDIDDELCNSWQALRC